MWDLIVSFYFVIVTNLRAINRIMKCIKQCSTFQSTLIPLFVVFQIVKCMSTPLKL